jgi:hypothetical protein
MRFFSCTSANENVAKISKTRNIWVLNSGTTLADEGIGDGELLGEGVTVVEGLSVGSGEGLGVGERFGVDEGLSVTDGLEVSKGDGLGDGTGDGLGEGCGVLKIIELLRGVAKPALSFI